jgi:hypothetical protein
MSPYVSRERELPGALQSQNLAISKRRVVTTCIRFAETLGQLCHERRPSLSPICSPGGIESARRCHPWRASQPGWRPARSSRFCHRTCDCRMTRPLPLVAATGREMVPTARPSRKLRARWKCLKRHSLRSSAFSQNRDQTGLALPDFTVARQTNAEYGCGFAKIAMCMEAMTGSRVPFAEANPLSVPGRRRRG